MIKIDAKPHKTVESFRGIIELDQEYEFIVEKTTTQPPTTGGEPYYVESVKILGSEDDIKMEVISLIEETVKNYCRKNGLGE